MNFCSILGRRPPRAAAFAVALLICAPAPGIGQSDETGPEPGVWNGVRYFATALASDAWASATAPARLGEEGAWLFGGVVATGAVLYAFDEPIYEELRRSRTDGFWAEVEDVGHTLDQLSLMGETNKYYAVGLVAGNVLDQLTGYDGPRHLFEELLISHWVAGALRKGVGRPIGRMRPEQGLGAYHYSFWKGTSFPSGHASTITQVATVLAHHSPWWPVDALLYTGAATVVYERVSTAKHWPSDSWIGAAWGWGVARIVIDRRESDRLDFVPFFEPVSGTVGLRMRMRW